MLEKRILNKKKIIIGSANFGSNYGFFDDNKKIKFSDVGKIIKYCEKNDIKFLDTAIGYQNSEEVFGRVKSLNWSIITKIPKITLQSSNRVCELLNNSVSNSLENLKAKSLYAVLLHDETQLLNSNGKKVFNCLKNLQKKKIIKKIGVSFYSPNILIKTLTKFKIDIIQIPINYINRSFLDKKVISIIKKNKIEVHARSIFLQGLLLKKKTNKKKFQKFLKYINYWHKINNITHLESSLNFFNNHKFINKYVIGLQSLNQLKQIIKTKKKIIKNLPKFDSNFVKDPRKWT